MRGSYIDLNSANTVRLGMAGIFNTKPLHVAGLHVSILASHLVDPKAEMLLKQLPSQVPPCVVLLWEVKRRTSVFRIFISVVATLREHLSSYTSQTSERCAHIYTGFFSFKYTYTGKGGGRKHRNTQVS